MASKDFKLTKRQQEILDLFESADDPLTSQQAWENAKKRGIEVGLATVYRAITRLVELRMLHTILIEDQTPLFEAASKPHHHHFYCQNCEKIFSIKKCPPSIDQLVPSGFRMTGHAITLYGVCKDCEKE